MYSLIVRLMLHFSKCYFIFVAAAPYPVNLTVSGVGIGSDIYAHWYTYLRPEVFEVALCPENEQCTKHMFTPRPVESITGPWSYHIGRSPPLPRGAFLFNVSSVDDFPSKFTASIEFVIGKRQKIFSFRFT